MVAVEEERDLEVRRRVARSEDIGTKGQHQNKIIVINYVRKNTLQAI